MPPERFDWSDQPPPQDGASPAGHVSAWLAEAEGFAPPRGGAPVVSGPPDLVVRTRRSDHQLRAGAAYRIGRDPESDIVMTDSRVSWRHGVLRAAGARWLLEDLGSTNGTFLGLQRLDRIEISADCVVRLGNPDDGPVLRCMPQPSPAAPVHPDGSIPPGPPVPPSSPEAGSRREAAPWWPPPADGRVSPPARTPSRPPAPPSGAPVRADLRPSVDRKPTARMPLPAKAMRIGRGHENDLVLSDLNVSRHHAELRKSAAGRYEIIDLDSHNGTFVNGQRVSSRTLTEQDIVSIGNSTFRLAGGELRQFVDDGNITFTAQDLVVKVGGGKILLDHVSFPIPEKCLLGVIGPSGAGKSTLLGALTGIRPATTGTVLYDNRDLYQNYDELRYRIGLVPQESVLHTQLTARRALQYAAELRFPADTGPAERDGRVDEVMAELGLTKHANTRADRLSGGQLKRVNVAQELLTKPSLLFLDEPTSGLDPGLDKSVMEQMRDLAHDGRTVIVVTHSVDNLDQCDRLLVLVPGGRIAFYGPPAEGLSYFGQSRWAEVFQDFERYPDRDWAAEYAASPAYAQYVLGQRPRPSQARPSQPLSAAPPPQRRGALRQMATLTRRYLRVIASDRGYLLFMGLLPVILGLLIHFVGTSQGLAGPPHTNQNAQEVLLMLVICACLAGTASSVRELVKERSIYIRERAAGLSSGAYLSSKLLVLGVISVMQSFILVLLGLGGRPLPPTGSFLTSLPLVELLLGVALLGLASMCLGLLVSALVSTSEKAMPFLVLLTMVQVILSGGVLSLSGKAGLTQLAMLAPARWGFGAVASTANLNVINPSAGTFTDPLWNHDASTWLKDMGLTLALAVIFTLLAWYRLRRLGPRRRRG
ncbi:MAG: FHA domain-containing protein [Actinobacteria bacterium]|nr:FHA domain-containing protein [Actinomycetota bacterium]